MGIYEFDSWPISDITKVLSALNTLDTYDLGDEDLAFELRSELEHRRKVRMDLEEERAQQNWKEGR